MVRGVDTPTTCLGLIGQSEDSLIDDLEIDMEGSMVFLSFSNKVMDGKQRFLLLCCCVV